MCGICGYITAKNIETKCIQKMTSVMIHRGPDDGGITEGRIGDFNFALGHRRLSIIDLSSAGHQPMSSLDGRYILVYNGELYNYLEIRDELLERGYSFSGNSDTEVLLYSFVEWGSSAFDKWNGMFSAAIVDNESQKLILVRDRIGQKPLYFYHFKDSFVFASELKAVMEWPGFRKELRTDVLPRYMYRGYIAGPDTIFVNTYKLRPGCFLEWQNNRIQEKQYWDIRRFHEIKSLNMDSYASVRDRLKQLLWDAVRIRMIADVPVGTFLSGGIDSSLISAIAQDLSGGRLKTFCIGFKDKGYDEADDAARIAKYLGTDHTELYLSTQELEETLNDIAIYYDEPFADSSQIPTMMVSKLARKDVKVVLSGDGGDELFCGYNAYDKVLKYEMAYKNREWYEQQYRLGDTTIEHMIDVFQKPEYLCQLIGRSRHSVLMPLKQLPVEYEEEISIDEESWQRRRMKLDVMTYLPDDILTKVDRGSMRYSLECRSPFCDYRVAEMAFSIPFKYLYSEEGEKKYILKDILSDVIPRKLFERSKKGFSIPVADCLRSQKDRVLTVCEKQRIQDQGLFIPEAIQSIADGIMNGSDDGAALLWKYFVFQEWYDQYM